MAPSSAWDPVAWADLGANVDLSLHPKMATDPFPGQSLAIVKPPQRVPHRDRATSRTEQSAKMFRVDRASHGQRRRPPGSAATRLNSRSWRRSSRTPQTSPGRATRSCTPENGAPRYLLQGHNDRVASARSARAGCKINTRGGVYLSGHIKVTVTDEWWLTALGCASVGGNQHAHGGGDHRQGRAPQNSGDTLRQGPAVGSTVAHRRKHGARRDATESPRFSPRLWDATNRCGCARACSLQRSHADSASHSTPQAQTEHGGLRPSHRAKSSNPS